MQASTPTYKTTVAGASMSVDYRVNVTLPVPPNTLRTNLILDPSFEGASTLWVPFGSQPPAPVQSPVQAFSGSKSLKITWPTSPGQFNTAAAYVMQTVPGARYVVGAYMYVPAGNPLTVLMVDNFVASTPLSGTDAWHQVNLIFTATATNHLLLATPTSGSGTTAGQFCYLDAVLMEAGSILGAYFDGDSAQSQWTGIPNQSTSQNTTSPFGFAPYANMTLSAEQVTVERQLTTDMPDGTRLITGYPAASAQVTLSGILDPADATKDAAWLFNPSDPSSPLYRATALGAPVTIQEGVYTPGSVTPELFTVFTGVVDDYTVSVDDGTVSLTCMDSRALLSKAPVLPVGAYAVPEGPQLFTSAWVLNQVCETMGRYASPPPRPFGVYRQTNHGGTWPETRWAGTVNPGIHGDATVPTPWTQGKFSPQVPIHSVFQFLLSNQEAPGAIGPADIGSSGNALFFECWVKPTTDASLVPTTFGIPLYRDLNALGLDIQGPDTTTLEIVLGATPTSVGSDFQPFATVLTYSPTQDFTTALPAITIPNDNQWHYLSLAFHFISTTKFTVTATVDASSAAATSGTMPVAAAASVAPASATVLHFCPAESIQVTNEPGTPRSNSTFTPSPLVSIAPSLNQLTTIPDTTNQDVWGLIQQIAAAESAVCGFDETGRFVFINRTQLRTVTSQRTITPTYSLKKLNQQLGRSFVKNHIQVPVNQLQVQPSSRVWAATTPLTVGAGKTEIFYASTSDPAVNIYTTAIVLPAGGGQPQFSGYRACTTPDGLGQEKQNITVTILPITSTLMKITATNPNNVPIWFVSPDTPAYPTSSIGLPSLVIGGNLITQVNVVTDTATETPTSQGVIADAQWPALPDGGVALNPDGELLLPVPSNPWMQQLTTGQALADDYLADLYKPRPIWRDVSIVPDPSLQVADLITITDPVTTLVTGTALIIGSHLAMSDTEWTQTLDLRATGSPGAWIMGVPGSSEMGVSTYV